MQKTLPNILRDSRWILPAGLALGAVLPLFQNGGWLIGWLASSVILLAGLIVLTASWRWAGKGRTLAWMIALALLLRLASAVALQVFLPINGYDNEQQHAGYVFLDAYRRDGQAWELSQSETPTWTAFNKQFYTDQYGGLLALSAGTYRYLSPDAHRPLLVVLLAALAAALGVPFFWKSAHSLGGDKLAIPASWIFALYPESILQGSSQMREPFLITFVAMAFWGLLDWQANSNRKAWLWFGFGLVGMLLFSPAIALVTLLILGGWLWFGKERQRVSWRMILAVSVVFLVGLFLLSWSLNRQGVFGTQSPFGVIADWFGRAVKWDVHQLERGSGWVQKLFGDMGTTARLLFVAGYGLAQPVLPATFIEPTTLTWRIIGILRALGWYLFAPLLIYGFFAASKAKQTRERNTWLWLGITTWTWVLVASLRAGGDQWDNPRYRVIFLAFQALFAGYAWAWQREHRDAWLPRLLAVEVVFLVFFTQWYANRYYDFFGQLPFWTMVAWIASLSGLILAGGWLWDRWQLHKNRHA